tara:strand:+ start:185 stop:415 length:231 start_codon:yes stop_codon:yes gene_type:complete
MAKKVRIYSGEGCQYCEMAKQYFKENNIEYEELPIEQPANAEQAQKISGGTGVPVIDIEGTIIIGFDAEKIEQALK